MWYIELRDSGAKYIAVYKERLDSLLSYQKKLHELCDSESSPELVLRAISELHKIEMSLHTLMKELPGDIKTSKDKTEENDREKKKTGHLNGLVRVIICVPGLVMIPVTVMKKTVNITGDCIRNTTSMLNNGEIVCLVLILLLIQSGEIPNYLNQ
jgi:hypothetical protein